MRIPSESEKMGMGEGEGEGEGEVSHVGPVHLTKYRPLQVRVRAYPRYVYNVVHVLHITHTVTRIRISVSTYYY